MILQEITLKNFYRYGNEQTLDLSGNGITSLCGINGVGKSTAIVDSIKFCLFGKYRCKTIDGVVNKYIGKDCKVGVTFLDGDDTYKIIRYRKHTVHNNNVYIFKNDKDISGHTTAETNALIIDIIKMNDVAFTNSCVFSSELYSAFLAKSISERLVIFENILSLKEINLFYTTIKDILKSLNNNLNEEEKKYISIESEINILNDSITEYNNNAKHKLIEMKQLKDNAKKIIENSKKKLEEYSIINILEEKGKLSNSNLKEEYSNRILNLKNTKKSFIVNEPIEELIIYNKYKDVNFEENRLIELKYKEDCETIKIREDGYKLEKEKINSLTLKLQSLEKTLNSNEFILKELNDKIIKLKESICPFCGQHLSSEKSELELENSNKKIKEILDENKDLNKEKEDLNISLKDANENYNWLIADANKLKENLNNKFVPNSELIEEQFNNAIKTINNLIELKKINEEKINSIDKEIEDITSKINSLETSNYTEEELNNIELKIKELNNLISDKEIEIANIDGSVKSIYDKKYVDNISEKIKLKLNEKETIKEKILNIDNDIKHYSYLGECFSNKSGGFKKYFIGEMIDLFNDKINQYLPFFFTEDVKITFDKDLNDTIIVDDFDFDFNGFSQGQRQRAELAINFALFDVARVFFSNDNKLLVLDEMDKGLDKFGIKAMVNILNGFDKQLRIFVVSHNPLLDDEIDDKIKIERDSNGFSKIKQ